MENSTSDAPGADDDASGVAVVLELARIFATRQFPGTLVLAAVDGEEEASQAFDGTKPDPRTVRLFLEGVPANVTPGQISIMQAVGGENDGTVEVINGVQFGDLLEFVDFDYVARVARVNAAVMWALATGPGTPKRPATLIRSDDQRVGNVTTVTLDISKDNVQFGVRAVGQDGHRSPVAFPQVAA